MPHIHSKSAKPATVALVIALASLMLAACGSSNSSSTTTTSTKASESASATTPTTSTPGPNAGHFSALRECLQKEGVTLPKREPGTRGPGFLGATPKLPAGESPSKLRAALRKCGASSGTFPGRGRFFNSPAVKQAYAKFASCMRANGVNLPEPNTSGKGPIFNTKGIQTTGSTFRSAEDKCRGDLVGAFHVRPGIRAPGAGAAGATTG